MTPGSPAWLHNIANNDMMMMSMTWSIMGWCNTHAYARCYSQSYVRRQWQHHMLHCCMVLITLWEHTFVCNYNMITCIRHIYANSVPSSAHGYNLECVARSTHTPRCVECACMHVMHRRPRMEKNERNINARGLHYMHLMIIVDASMDIIVQGW